MAILAYVSRNFSGSTCGYPRIIWVYQSLTRTHPGQSTHRTRTHRTQPTILPAGVTRTDIRTRPTHAMPYIQFPARRRVLSTSARVTIKLCMDNPHLRVAQRVIDSNPDDRPANSGVHMFICMSRSCVTALAAAVGYFDFLNRYHHVNLITNGNRTHQYPGRPADCYKEFQVVGVSTVAASPSSW